MKFSLMPNSSNDLAIRSSNFCRLGCTIVLDFSFVFSIYWRLNSIPRLPSSMLARIISGKFNPLYKKFPMKDEYWGTTFKNLILSMLHLLFKLLINAFLIKKELQSLFKMETSLQTQHLLKSWNMLKQIKSNYMLWDC